MIALHFPPRHSISTIPLIIHHFPSLLSLLLLLFTYLLLLRLLFDFTCPLRRLPSAVSPALLPFSSASLLPWGSDPHLSSTTHFPRRHTNLHFSQGPTNQAYDRSCRLALATDSWLWPWRKTAGNKRTLTTLPLYACAADLNMARG